MYTHELELVNKWVYRHQPVYRYNADYHPYSTHEPFQIPLS